MKKIITLLVKYLGSKTLFQPPKARTITHYIKWKKQTLYSTFIQYKVNKYLSSSNQAVIWRKKHIRPSFSRLVQNFWYAREWMKAVSFTSIFERLNSAFLRIATCGAMTPSTNQTSYRPFCGWDKQNTTDRTYTLNLLWR